MRREITNQHGIICPTENEAIKAVTKDERKRVRNILRNWGKADRENERLKAEYDVIIEEIGALYGIRALASDGLPKGNKVTHPTEDTAIAVMNMIDRRKSRLDEIKNRIAENKKLVARIEYAMTLAKNAAFLRRNYHDCVRPMEKLAEEFHISVRQAWLLENEGVDSIAHLL